MIITNTFWRTQILLETTAEEREPETTQHTAGARCALAQGDYTHRPHQVNTTVHLELTIECGLSKGPPMLYYKCGPQSVLENAYYELYNDRPRQLIELPQQQTSCSYSGQNHQRSIFNRRSIETWHMPKSEGACSRIVDKTCFVSETVLFGNQPNWREFRAITLIVITITTCNIMTTIIWRRE